MMENMSEPEDFDVEFEDESFDGEKGKPILAALYEKCAKFGITCERDDEDFGQFVRIEIKRGRGKQIIYLGDIEKIDSFTKSNFEKFVFLEEVEAIWNPEDKRIEAAIQSVPGGINNRALMAFFNVKNLNELREKLTDGVTIDSGKENHPTIQIILPSDEFQALVRRGSGRSRADVMLSLININVENGPQAYRLLQKIADSLFFQLDMIKEYSFELIRIQGPRDRLIPEKDENSNLVFPHQEYEYAPVSLYWYARSANRLPLLQYLAYYQTIEYFFGHYAVEDARKKIKFLLKNPAFRLDRDTDISRIVDVVGNSRNGIGSEREQLLTTINSCLSAEDIREFLSVQAITEFLTSEKSKHFHSIPIRNRALDLRGDLATRIYDIRCRIVHTKADGGRERVDLLLPFSREAGLLGMDIEIIKFVSRQILINSSSEFRI